MTKRYAVTRAAVEVAQVDLTPAQVELAAIERQQRRWSWLSIATMIVSFIHMVGALALFSDGSLMGTFAAILMTALVDGATWVVANYTDYAKRRNKQRNLLVSTLLWVALTISFGLNLAYLLVHRPSNLNMVIGVGIAFAFAAFIPLCIGVASLARGELEDDKLQPQNPVNVDKKTRVRVVDKPHPILDVPPSDAQLEPMVDETATEDRGADWLRRRVAGETFSDIAKSVGVSRQYVSRVVATYQAQLSEVTNVQ